MSTFLTACLSSNTYLVIISSFQNVVLVTMITTVMNRVMDSDQMPVIRCMVSVQILLDVNLDGSLDMRSVI
jgi:hypothetical protein